jgi:formate--tetrahydrofolate ligase
MSIETSAMDARPASFPPRELSRIEAVADLIGLTPAQLVVQGPYRAKVRLDALEGIPARRARYVLVTGVTPSGRGAGKTVTAVGLGMGLRRLGHVATVTLRQSSFGPTFGGKGGGGGGGLSGVVPLEECLLGLGADDFAVEAANNLLAAVVEDALRRGGFEIDPSEVTWRRVVDTDDRSLRQVRIGLGGPPNGPERTTGFDITAASEVMAILMMSRDLHDLRARLDAVVPAWNVAGKPVTAGMLSVAGSMAAILRDALQPNLMQSHEGTPVLVHTGPFGNIAPGNASVVGDLIALGRSDYVVTEAGFASDLGAEKFFDLKCPATGQYPDAAVLVATVPCLRGQGEGTAEEALVAGTRNLVRHIEILREFGARVVVALNRFPEDTAQELAMVRQVALDAGAHAVALNTSYTEGGEGSRELAEAVVDACDAGSACHPLFEHDAPVEAKVETIATRVYGAAQVEWAAGATGRLERFRDAGFGNLPVCVAKTHLSISHDPAVKGAPSGYVMPVREVRLAAGAGYVTCLAGDISTMPGMPSKARFREIDLDSTGRITGLT